jgi:DNA-binding response OmpR family regulator
VKKVLIVESLKSLLDQERTILTNGGFQTFTATSGEEAVAIHRTEKVDLILTRLDVQGIGGESLCSFIRKDDALKKVSLIVVCDNARRDLERSQECGANAVVTRPVDPEVLLQKVNQLIDIPQRAGMRVLIKVSPMGNQPFFCTSVNISTSGILLEVDRTISKAALVTCSFFIPGSDSISVDGEIVRVTEVSPQTFHWGIRFLNLGREHKPALEAFVKKKI